MYAPSNGAVAGWTGNGAVRLTRAPRAGIAPASLVLLGHIERLSRELGRADSVLDDLSDRLHALERRIEALERGAPPEPSLDAEGVEVAIPPLEPPRLSTGGAPQGFVRLLARMESLGQEVGRTESELDFVREMGEPASPAQPAPPPAGGPVAIPPPRIIPAYVPAGASPPSRPEHALFAEIVAARPAARVRAAPADAAPEVPEGSPPAPRPPTPVEEPPSRIATRRRRRLLLAATIVAAVLASLAAAAAWTRAADDETMAATATAPPTASIPPPVATLEPLVDGSPRIPGIYALVGNATTGGWPGLIGATRDEVEARYGPPEGILPDGSVAYRGGSLAVTYSADGRVVRAIIDVSGDGLDGDDAAMLLAGYRPSDAREVERSAPAPGIARVVYDSPSVRATFAGRDTAGRDPARYVEEIHSDPGAAQVRTLIISLAEQA